MYARWLVSFAYWAIEIWVFGFAIWQVYALVGILVGANFEGLIRGSVLPILLLTVFLIWSFRSKTSKTSRAVSPEPIIFPRDRSPLVFPWVGLTLLSLATLVCWQPTLYPLFWVGAALCLLKFALDTPGILQAEPKPRLSDKVPWIDPIILFAIAALAVTIILTAVLPNADDAYYLNAAVSTARYPALPLLSFDGMHGDPTVPHHKIVHRVQSYELLVAVLHSLSGIDIWALYYLWIPAIAAALFAPIYWATLREFGLRLAGWGVLAACLALLFWGEGIRTYGNFGFVRLFQGKGIFVTLGMPLVVYSALRWAREPAPLAFARLTASIFGTATFSSSALVVAPVGALLAIGGSVSWTREGIHRVLVSSLAYLPSITVLLGIALLTKTTGIGAEGQTLGLTAVLGHPLRGGIFLAALPLLPMLACKAGAFTDTAMIHRYSALLILCLFNGISAPIAGTLLPGVFSWRLYWAAPAGLLIGMAVALSVEGMLRHRQKFAAAGLAIVVLVFAGSGAWTTSSENGLSWDFLAPKLDPVSLIVAEAAIAHTEPGETILAPWPISQVIALSPEAPPLIGVRPHYVYNLGFHWGNQEVQQRIRLVHFVSGWRPEHSTINELAFVEAEIQRRQVYMVVIAPNEWAAALQARLQGLNFMCQPVEQYILCSQDS